METRGNETSLGVFAESIGVPLKRLSGELREIGMEQVSPDTPISREDKMRLLLHLRKRRGNDDPNVEPQRLILRRRTLMELKGVTNVQGPHRQRVRTRSIAVEFRKSRTYYKRGHMTHHEEEQEKERPLLPEMPEKTPITAEAGVPAEAGPAEMATPVEADASAEVATPVEADASAEVATPVEADMPPEDQPASPVEPVTVEPEAQATADSGDQEEPAPAAGSEPAAATAAAQPEAKPEKSEIDVKAVEPVPDGTPKKKGKYPEARHKSGVVRRDDDRQELHVAKEKSGRRRKKKARASPSPLETQHTFQKPVAPMVREINVPETITVADLAQRMAIKSQELIKLLMDLGTMVTINQSIDQDTAIAVIEEMGHKACRIKEDRLEEELMKSVRSDGDRQPRWPVVTVMGHVDHGKTTLIDHIRSSRIADREAGGITQQVGAYTVSLPQGGGLTMIDTPGHEAFSAMRARGARITDIVIIVVAADDGVKTQTKEAITHATAADIPIIVAVNKIDKPEADIEKVRQEMAREQVVPEDWGGDVVFVPLSAKTGEGLNNLLAAINLQAELLELKAVATGPAGGTVLEARNDRSRGPVATLLVQSGSLRTSDFLLAGGEFGRVRLMMDENGQEISEAGPSRPVVVLGLSGPPEAGDMAMVVADERKARELADQRRSRSREKELAARARTSTQDAMERMDSGEPGETTELRVVLKTDTQGIMEALAKALSECSTEAVHVNVIASGVGGITVSDVNLMLASNSILVGFNVRADSQARRLLRDDGREARYYSVIYDLIDDIKAMAAEREKSETRDEIIGLAEVKEVFRAARVGEVAGCVVTEGMVRRGFPIRVLRDNVVIYEGELESLRRFKNDVQEVKSGLECGIGVRNYKNIRTGDQIEVFAKAGQSH